MLLRRPLESVLLRAQIVSLLHIMISVATTTASAKECSYTIRAPAIPSVISACIATREAAASRPRL